MADEPIMSVKNLRVSYNTGVGTTIEAVRDVSFDVYPGESLALVGESGCGKSTLGLALLRLLPRLGYISGGEVWYRYADGLEAMNVVNLHGRALRAWRWTEVAMVFQGAMNAFNPVLKIEQQFADTLRAHTVGKKPKRAELRDEAAEKLEAVRLDPARVLPSYPHELSGGMRQRALIALSLLLEPRVLVLDEPTTALDLLTQRSIVLMLHELRERLGFSMIFVSHDLPLASELADRVATMYAGRIVESGNTRDIFLAPRHPYTAGLIKATPPLHAEAAEPISIPGSPPDLGHLPPGCSFAPRCGYAIARCRTDAPETEFIEERLSSTSHDVECWRWEDVHLADVGVKEDAR